MLVVEVPPSPWSSLGSMLMMGHALAEDTVLVLGVALHPRLTELLTVLQLVEPEVIEAQDTTKLVTVEVAVQDELLVFVAELPSSPWSSFGSMLITGHELADEVVVVRAVALQPRLIELATVLQLVEPDVTEAQDTTKFVTVDVTEQDDDVLEDLELRVDEPLLCEFVGSF